jgi:nucleoside-diphosphate-sugar epimerase
MACKTSPETVLITGGCGFLGQHLAQELIERGFRVVVFDLQEDKSLLDPASGSEKWEFVCGDVTNFPELMEALSKHEVKSVVHAAAILPPYSECRPYQSLLVNVLGTFNVLEAARLRNLRRVSYVSSGAVYGTHCGKCQEDSPIPLQLGFGLYGPAKASCELVGLKYSELYDVSFVSVRNAAIYGPGVTSPHYLNILVRDALAGKKIVLERGADHRFEFIHVKDAAAGIRMIHTAEDLKHRLYNLGTGQSHSLNEVAAEIRKIIPQADISLGPGLLEDLPQRPPFDISRIRELGYAPQFNLYRGLQNFVDCRRRMRQAD